MKLIFFIIGIINIISAINVVLQTNLIYSLLYFISYIISISCIFFALNFELIGYLNIIIYAGAIMILFVFVAITIRKNNNKTQNYKKYKYFLKLPLPLSLLYLIIYSISQEDKTYISFDYNTTNEKEIGLALFGGPYFLITELSSILLLASLIITLHFNNET
ncbi:MAG: NADH:quinone oxidoreductase subunit J [Candidatus Westeberhardia cardiocondylae]|nr:NADH:quinone oxidoreductase subunit J [Candidatus Westeberhardia cardiocondylae]